MRNVWIFLLCFYVSIASALTPQETREWLTPYGVEFGPLTVNINDKASLPLRAGFVAIDRFNTDQFFEDSGQLPQNNTTYVIGPDDMSWYAMLHYRNEGFVDDSEEIDAGALMSAIREGNAANNKMRREKGFDLVTMNGWAMRPTYDSSTQLLSWGLDYQFGAERTYNYTSRLLGRSGFVSATLITYPEVYQQHISEFESILERFSFVKGERYSEFREGDKVAKYGLAALITGGAVAVVAKSWKLIYVAIIAGIAAVWAGLKRVFQRRS
ncbi:MAG: DUF2167 domain-containing protein [Burkholderiales bacterium]|nr:DUF2167 domain-containing protein [Burkholderiales bacterium]